MNFREQPQVPPQHPQQPPLSAASYLTSAAQTHHHYPSMIHANIPPPAAASGGFPFNAIMPARPEPKQLPSSSSDGGFDGSSPPSSGMGFSIEPAKKKRGRPRKYAPDGNIALGLLSSPSPVSAVRGDSGGGTAGSGSEPPAKRNRGRPPGTGKKQMDALGGVAGVGFTPHVISVEEGQDITAKIMAFSQQGPRTVCILSANGAIGNVTLRQPAMSGGTVTYEGRFEIISLSGSFLLSENDGNRSRTGGLSVSLAGSDGRVLGGGVAGMLKAASPVQVIVGSFIADGKKPNSNVSKSGPPAASPSQMMNFGAPLTATSPPSQGGSSGSSDENGGSPINRSPVIYNTTNQPIHGMQMYHLWAGQNPQ